MDISELDAVWVSSEESEKQRITRPLVARSMPLAIERLKDRRPAIVQSMVAAARVDDNLWSRSPSFAWNTDTVPGPNITDKDTVLTLAQMTANCY